MRSRLSLLLLVLMSVVLISLGVPVAIGQAASEARSVHADRLADLALFASLVPVTPDARQEDALRRELRRYDDLYGITVGVVDAAGRPRFTSRSQLPLDRSEVRAALGAALAGRLPEGPDRLWPWDDRPVPAAQPLVQDGDVVGAVLSVSPVDRARGRVLRGWALLAAAELVALLVVASLAQRLAGWLLRPIARLDAATHRIAEGDLAARVPVASGPPELRRLGGSFNDMAGHVQAALEAQRAFVADASHQLRNPLAALLVRLEGITLVPPHRRPQAAASAVEDGRHLAETLDRMLELARAEHAATEAGPVDVGAVVADRLRFWQVVATRRSIALCRAGEAHAAGWHDAGALGGAIDAVLDNALKYAPERSTVTVELRAGRPGDSGPGDGDRAAAGTVDVVVSDEGPGLTGEDLRRIADRFWRAHSTSREPGSGLGVSIATALLERHGGRLEAESVPGSGLRVHLVVPAAPVA